MSTQEFKEFEKFLDLMYVYSRKLHPYQVSARQYGTEDKLFMIEVHTVRTIGRNPKITITEIAKETERTKSAVSQMVDKLKDKGILEKVKDPEDQRRYVLQLTQKGKTIYDYHEALDKENYGIILREMRDVDISDIGSGIKLVGQIIKAMDDKDNNGLRG